RLDLIRLRLAPFGEQDHLIEGHLLLPDALDQGPKVSGRHGDRPQGPPQGDLAGLDPLTDRDLFLGLEQRNLADFLEIQPDRILARSRGRCQRLGQAGGLLELRRVGGSVDDLQPRKVPLLDRILWTGRKARQSAHFGTTGFLSECHGRPRLLWNCMPEGYLPSDSPAPRSLDATSISGVSGLAVLMKQSAAAECSVSNPTRGGGTLFTLLSGWKSTVQT